MRDDPPNEWRRGWRPLLASTVGYGAGIANLSMTASLFVRPMQAELGWSTKAVAFMPLTMIVLALVTPLVGVLLDRVGSRGPALAGLLLFSASLAAMALVPPTKVGIFSVAVLLGVTGSLVSTATFARCVATWFERNAGGAFGITMNGSAFVALATLPLTSAIIQLWGWRAGFLGLSTITGCVGFPVLLALFRERPVTTDPTPGANRKQQGSSQGLADILGTPRFWAVLIAIGLAGLPLGGFLGHLVPILESGGLSVATATSMTMVYAASVTLGRVGGGLLLDRFWDGGVAALLLALAATGGMILTLPLASGPSLLPILGVLLVGLGQGLEADFIAYFAVKMFGLEKYSTVVSFYSMAAGVMMSFGVFVFSALFDHYQTYVEACTLAAACLTAAGLILFVTRWNVRKHPKATLAS